MKIYQVNLGDRLGRRFEPLPAARKAAARYLLVVHPHDVEESVATDLRDWLGDPDCRGVLYVRGVPHAGLSREKAGRIERENNGRVHFLSYSVGDHDDLIGGLGDRFSRFYEKVEREDEIDWRLIDEAWPENLLAAYLVAKALSILDSDGAGALIAEGERWAPAWQAARDEYYLRTLRDLPCESLNARNAREVAETIRSYLEESPYGGDNAAVSISKKIRHDWLLHEVLILDAEYISRLYTGASPDRDRFDERIMPGGAFERYFDKARDLSAAIIDGFSPALLVHAGPLEALSERARAMIGDGLHDAYIEQTDIEQLSRSIELSVSELYDRYDRFIKGWYNEPPVEQVRIRERFEEVQRAARVLYGLLGRLPKGVVLP